MDEVAAAVRDGLLAFSTAAGLVVMRQMGSTPSSPRSLAQSTPSSHDRRSKPTDRCVSGSRNPPPRNSASSRWRACLAGGLGGN